MSQWNRMSEEEIDEFLGRGGTGVVAFATEADEPPVAIPVSYGYNADIEAFYFQLSVPGRTGKTSWFPARSRSSSTTKPTTAGGASSRPAG